MSCRTRPACRVRSRRRTMRGVPTARLRVCLFVALVVACVAAQSDDAPLVTPIFPSFSTQAPAASDAPAPLDDFGDFGAFDVTQSMIRIPATTGYGLSVSDVPDLGGEAGTVLCYHPREKKGQEQKFPLVYYQHPTHGFTFDGWIGQNDLMLRILASKGSVVCSPMMVGEKDGTGVNAAIIGGLFPGQQTSAQVVARKVYPRLVEFAPHALTQLLRISMQGDLEGANPNFPDALRNSINPNSLAMMGFSAGAAIAVYSADSLNQQWPGAVKAIVALAPTIGDFTFARDSFELAAPRITIPMLLLTGAEDGMGGLEGLVEIGDTAKNAPRIGVVVESGTHCHLYVPIGSQCDLSPRNDVGGVGAVGRFVSSAFLTAYLELPNVGFTEKSRAVRAVWGGASVLNKLGKGVWRTKTLAEPLLTLQLSQLETLTGETPVATATYTYDPSRDTWRASLTLLLSRSGNQKCLTEVRVVDEENENEENESSLGTSAANTLEVSLDANQFDDRYAQPVGNAVIAFPFPGSNENAIQLNLEWSSDSVDTRLRGAFDGWESSNYPSLGRRLLGGANDEEEEQDILANAFGVEETDPTRVLGAVPWPSTDPLAEIMIRAQGVTGGANYETQQKTKRVRLRGLDLCDGGSAFFFTLAVAPPRLTPPGAVGSFAARRTVGAQGDKKIMVLEDPDFSPAKPPMASVDFSNDEAEDHDVDAPRGDDVWEEPRVDPRSVNRAAFSLSG